MSGPILPIKIDEEERKWKGNSWRRSHAEKLMQSNWKKVVLYHVILHV